MRKSHKGQEKVKKVYSVGFAPAHEVRAESASVDFLGDAQKLEGQTNNGGKPGTLVRSKKKSAENDMPRQDPLKGKLATSEGSQVLDASVDYRGDCFQFRAITRKMIGNGDLPSSKRSIFKDERVNSSKNSSKNESSHFIEAKRNNKNPSIISSGSIRADNCTPSTTEPYDNMNRPQLMKSFNGFKGSGDVSISSSAGIEDLIKTSFSGTNGRNFKHNKTSGTHVRPRRRALRFVEDDDGEECRTPIHHVTAVTLLREYSGTFDSERKSQMQPESCKDFSQNASLSNTGFSLIGNVGSRVDEIPNNLTGNMEMMESCFSASRPRNVEANVLKYSADLLECSNSVKQKKFKTAFPNGRAANEKLGALVSPGNTDKLVSLKTLKDQVREESPYNAQFGESCKAFGTSHFSCSPSISQNHKLSLEKSKSNISGLTVTENSSINFSAECYTEKDVLAGQRSDITREATSADSSADSKFIDSGMSMKHLIAAAQAKRRQAHSHQLHDGNGTPRSSLTPQCIRGRSPNQMSTVQTLPSGGDPFQKEKKWFQTSVHNEPSLTLHQFLPAKCRDREDFDHRPSTRNLQPTDSSSGSTEAAVARDALEGMIETLSRTRDSIGRATRHAIDCAKYGIANEVVELLIHKLEGEPSLSHRIDLFFLVDSITQCSHAQKGIAGASYVPVVQAALPRLLGAAAPAGASAHENRRQCLKVLRLWLERRILPEYFLRSCMDEIEVRNDGLNSEVSHRIPSCVEQCVDDPIREMESLLVDQYGSNTTFLFAGILSADDLEGDEDFRSSPYTGTTDCSPHEAGGVSEVLLGSEGRRMDAHHHALEHVENEIEMEDALTISPDERSIGGGSPYSLPDQENCSVFESTCWNQNELLLLREGSPPLPLDPPPTTPPLPPSPPPPAPSPPSSLPPMPPPKLPPTIPLPLELSAVISLTQSQMPLSSCPYRCSPSLPQEYCRMENDKQLLQPIGKNAPEVSTVEVKNDSVVQQSPIFLATEINNTEFMCGITSSIPFEIAHGRHLTHEVSYSSKLFQQCGDTIQQMPLDSALPALRILNHPLLSSQMLSDHLSHGNSICQHHLQQKYSPYTSTFLLGQRKYGAEEQCMSHCSDVDQDYYDAWNIGRKIPSCSSAPPVQDGCCRLNMERTSTSIDFHHPPHFSAPSQASLTGDSFHNFTGIDFWRPA